MFNLYRYNLFSVLLLNCKLCLKDLYYPFLLTVFFSTTSSFSQAGLGGSIKGKVFDETKGMPFVNVALFQFGNMRGGATTDMEGHLKLIILTQVLTI